MNNSCQYCELCGSQSVTDNYFIPQYNISNSNIISKCNDCNFLFKTHQITDDIKLTDGGYYSAKKVGGKIDKRFINHFSKRAKDHYRFIKQYINTQPKIALDIGCGAGFFIKELLNDNWNVKGIEPDPIMSKYAIDSKLNVKPVLLSDFNTLDKFGLIYLSHVLDDIPNINITLDKINHLLSSNGILFIEVPNYSWNYRLNFIKKEDFLIGNYYFTIRSLKAVMAKHNFGMIKQYTFESVHTNTLLQKITSPLRMVSKLKPPAMKSYLRGIFRKL